MGGCFSFSSNKEKNGAKQSPKIEGSAANDKVLSVSENSKVGDNWDPKKDTTMAKDGQIVHIGVQAFTFRELAIATKNFHLECLLREGGFGYVYKGCLQSTGQVVAVEHLDRNSDKGMLEFMVEVLMLSIFRHANLLNLIGYCADGNHRFLVHKFMPLGSLEDHVHHLPPDKEPLDWNTRMKIAVGVAKGLEYLHNTANPPVVYRELRPSNILLDEGYHPKLSNFGSMKHYPVDHRVCGSAYTYAYCPPEGPFILKSDVYSFGVVLLELVTGRKPIDYTRACGEHYLVYWARTLFKDRKNLRKMADPLLQGRYPRGRLYQALVVAAMCLQEQAAKRPDIGSVVAASSYLA